MLDGKNEKDRQLERILNQYINDLNQGNKPDKNMVLKECPVECLGELDDILSAVYLLKRNIPLSVRIELEKKKISTIAKEFIRKNQAEDYYTQKVAANFRKNRSITEEEEKVVEDCILDIIKELEGGKV